MSVDVLTLADVFEALTGRRPKGLDEPISRTVIDSRQVEPGALFIAFEGERVDGHEYIIDAFSHGAVAAIVEREVVSSGMVIDLADPSRTLPAAWSLPLVIKTHSSLLALQQMAAFWRQRHAVRVIGITGSVGKTTTKELVAAVLARRYVTLKSEASYNNEIGLPLTLLHLTERHERVILEMGMYDVGEISDLARIARPDVGVVTIVGPVHLERAGTIERIVEAKQELVEALPPEGVAILNYDDERVRGMARATQARIFTYGLSPEADLWADQIEGLGLDGIRFQLHHGDEVVYVRIPLLGRHSVHTALRAAAVGLIEDLSWQEIIEGLRGPSAQLRLVAVPGPKGTTILDDTYNASPASTLAALNLLDELDGRKLAVLGDMLELGDYEREGHVKVGMRALEVVDVLITVGLRGRIIGETAVRWGMPEDHVHMVEENAQAVALLERMITGDEVILIKGSRTMKMEDIVNALVRA